jgi:hypothetical protein
MADVYFFRETVEKRFLSKYITLRNDGYSHFEAKRLGCIGIDYNLDEKALKSRIKRHKLLYGNCMYVSFVFLAIMIRFGFFVNALILVMVIVFLYKVLMRLRMIDESMEVGK